MSFEADGRGARSPEKVGGLGAEATGKFFKTTPSRLSENEATPLLDIKIYWICLTALKVPILLLF